MASSNRVNGQAPAQHRPWRAQGRSARRLNFACRILRFRPETQPRTGVALADGAGDLQPAGAVASRKPMRYRCHRADVDLEHGGRALTTLTPRRQAAEKVVLAAELAAGVQSREDQLHAGDLFLGVDVDRHAAAVIGNLAAAVLVKGHLDLARVPGEGLVDRVVHHFLRQVVGARGVGVHAGPALDRVQAGQDFDIGCVVAGTHVWGGREDKGEPARMALLAGPVKAGIDAGQQTRRARGRPSRSQRHATRRPP